MTRLVSKIQKIFQIDFCENGQTGYVGRQLQTVEMGNDDTRKNFVKGRFLKLVLKQNHPIKLNEFNQVSSTPI